MLLLRYYLFQVFLHHQYISCSTVVFPTLHNECSINSQNVKGKRRICTNNGDLRNGRLKWKVQSLLETPFIEIIVTWMTENLQMSLITVLIKTLVHMSVHRSGGVPFPYFRAPLSLGQRDLLFHTSCEMEIKEIAAVFKPWKLSGWLKFFVISHGWYFDLFTVSVLVWSAIVVHVNYIITLHFCCCRWKHMKHTTSSGVQNSPWERITRQHLFRWWFHWLGTGGNADNSRKYYFYLH